MTPKTKPESQYSLLTTPKAIMDLAHGTSRLLKHLHIVRMITDNYDVKNGSLTSVGRKSQWIRGVD